jgi:hypothetical protein
MTQASEDWVCETEVDFLARAIIAQHGPEAAYAAEHHLDQLVRWGSSRCDTWTAVADAIYFLQSRRDDCSAPESDRDQLRRITPLAR